MSAKTDTKAARLVAFGHAIQEGYFDPSRVNMSELARLMNVHRSTIMRDLRSVEEVIEEAKRLQALLRQAPVGETYRNTI